ncbi:hypothetical protein ACO11K_000586 [Bacillus cytotoxicus]|uniref:hypothetical protein n=1 Tax=Bacillus cereus group sp. BfR-BA-01492 TaxID=2920361 RepID=UPI001F5943DC|nr:hypothetical protein [Bacillus cereus group sp. BfR-BA-01492]EMA6344315.1 hypothetical protein [Bacillus cytotoxicus]EMA6345350.1 hypothetical protein [Bacillus cytotoxicus]
MKKKRSYSTKKAVAEFAALYIWARFMIIGAFINALLVVMFGPHNKLGTVGILFCVVIYITSAFFMVFHLIRYLRYYFRQE